MTLRCKLRIKLRVQRAAPGAARASNRALGAPNVLRQGPGVPRALGVRTAAGL